MEVWRRFCIQCHINEFTLHFVILPSESFAGGGYLFLKKKKKKRLTQSEMKKVFRINSVAVKVRLTLSVSSFKECYLVINIYVGWQDKMLNMGHRCNNITVCESVYTAGWHLKDTSHMKEQVTHTNLLRFQQNPIFSFFFLFFSHLNCRFYFVAFQNDGSKTQLMCWKVIWWL